MPEETMAMAGKRVALWKKQEKKNKKECSSRQLKKRRNEYQPKLNLLTDKQGNTVVRKEK